MTCCRVQPSSKAALASATATRQTSEGNVATAEATYVQVVGYPAPSDLVEPQPLKLPVQTAEDAARVAQDNNPNVIDGCRRELCGNSVASSPLQEIAIQAARSMHGAMSFSGSVCQPSTFRMVI